jgi:hypothetical protein
LRKSSAASWDFTFVVITESSTYSPGPDCFDVEPQAAKPTISITSRRQRINIFLVFMAITPFFQLVAKGWF